jgi:hypothetical protein
LEEANAQILLWQQPEFPYRVLFPAAVINEIRILAVEAFYSVPRGGVEIGGVFFGRRQPGALEVRAYRPIKCQYATGPSFTLSVNDQLGLSGLLESASEDPELQGLEPLGWYHSHTRSEIFLSAPDLQLYNEFFPERWQIALVMRPANLQPTRGGFFFRDRMGGVKSDAPFQEFKLEPPDFGLAPYGGQGTPGERPAPALVPAPAPPVDEPVLAAPAEPVKPVATPSKIVLIREPQAPEPLPADPPATPAPLAAAASANGATLVAAAAVREMPVPPPAPEPAPQPSTIESPEVNIPRFLAENPPTVERWTGWIWAVLILLLLGAGGAFAYWKFGPLQFGKTAELGLETYDINGSFLIRWDRESKVVRTATRAVIEIQDGADKPVIELSRGELTMGGCGYVRRSGQVSVHMKVEGDYPAEEYSNFSSAQSLGSQQAPTPESESGLQKALADKEHLKTELINESMQSLELRQQISDLKRQLAEERAKNATAPK